MSVFYKFKSALTFDTIQFDDLHISLHDFKKAVIQRSQPGKSTNFDLQVTNAETNEVYSDDNALIPKNSSLIVVRVPLLGSQKKAWDIGELGSKIGVLTPDYMQEDPGSIVVKSADLAALNASEEDKIKAVMFQSNVDYDPANYSRMKGNNQSGEPPPNYICNKCRLPNHWIKDCPITVVPDIKKSSGIPQSFMTPVEDPSVPGALMTPTGTFAVPTIDMHAYKEGKKEKPFIPSEETETSSKPIIPDDLLCTICQDILTDAVMMPCCGNSFCDECIRNILIESEENQCPDCKEKDTSPETLIPNRFLRNAVNNFRNKTGYKGGGHRVKRNETETVKSPAIEQDQDIEIIGTIPVEAVKKTEIEPDSEKGSAIVVLGSQNQQRGLMNRIPTNGTQKLPNIHVEHRPPLGRPIMPSEGMQADVSRPVGYVSCPSTTASSGRPNLSTIVISHSNGLRTSPDTGGDVERKTSPPLLKLSHPPPGVNRMPVLPNTSQLPPGYNPQTLPPLNAHYGGSVRPILPTYGPPSGVNSMPIPSHLTSQSGPVRIYPPYSSQNIYTSQMGGGYRSAASHHRMRPHHAPYGDRPVVEDPLEAFERHLRERERQDRMRRNRSRRSRSRSSSRVKSRSRSRQRSRSLSVSKKRTHSKSPSPRKDSPQIKRDSRSPVQRRSKSRSRSLSRVRSDSLGPNSMPPSKSPSPISVSMKKKTDSLSPSPVGFKKRSRSATPPVKKSNRTNHSRSRSRSRSKSVNRTRKRRRSRSRSRSVSSRSVSRGRSYSRSPSPPTRTFRSPSHSHRGKRSSRSPPRHPYPHSSRHRGSHYQEPPPFHNPSNFYEQNEHRIFKRGGRGSRYPRGGGRYSHSSQIYEGHNKYDRYGGNPDRYEDKRYMELNNRPYYPANEHPRNRRGGDPYHHAPSQPDYEQYYHNYGEVAPPGTTDLNSAAVHYGSGGSVPYNENVPPMYHERRSGSVDRYHRRSPIEYDDRGAAAAKMYKESAPPPIDDYKKSSRDYDKERRRSRERYHSHHRDLEQLPPSSHHRSGKRHASRTPRVPSQSPPTASSSGHRGGDRDRVRDRKHRSRGRSVDKENKTSSRADRGMSHKRESSAVRGGGGDDHHHHHHHHHHHGVLLEKMDQSSEGEKVRFEAAVDERKDEYKEKKEKSKRKKKKESDAEKKKRKKPKTSKKDGGGGGEGAVPPAAAPSKAAAETLLPAREDVSADELNEEQEAIHRQRSVDEHTDHRHIKLKLIPANSKNDSLYGDLEDTKVDVSIIENYGRLDDDSDVEEDEENRDSSAADKSAPLRKDVKSDDDNDVILAAVPELSKWERDDVSSPSDELQHHRTSASGGGTSKRTSDDKKLVTSEILKRAENALFQKSSSKAGSRSEAKSEAAAAAATAAAGTLSKDDGLLAENAREARKSGNSIQVTVPAVAAAATATSSINKSEDESRLASSAANFGRISAKDRLGAKVDERNYATTTVRSLVEAKIKPRSISSTVKCVADAKHSSAPKSDAAVEKLAERDKRLDAAVSTRRVDDKSRKDGRHSDQRTSSKHRGADTSKEKSGRRSDEHHVPRKEKEKSKLSKEEAAAAGTIESRHRASADDAAGIHVMAGGDKSLTNESCSVNEVKSILEKKRPCLDEAAFEPDYDLTSESEGEIVEKERKMVPLETAEEPVASRKAAAVDSEARANAAPPKMKEQMSNETSSSEASSDSSTDSSAERRKRKKRKSKKRKRAKKRKAYSSDSESEESSDSDSDSDTRSKRKKKHRHKTKKASRSAKKKKRTKHR